SRGWPTIPPGQRKLAGASSNGRTSDFDSEYQGSNPCAPATSLSGGLLPPPVTRAKDGGADAAEAPPPGVHRGAAPHAAEGPGGSARHPPGPHGRGEQGRPVPPG